MYIPYIFKEVFRRKSRTLTNVLTVAVIIAMPLSVTAILSAYTSAIYLPFKHVDSDMILQKSYNTTNLTSEIRVPFGKGTFDDGEIAGISTLSHVQDTSRSLVLWDFDKNGFASLEGIEPFKVNAMALFERRRDIAILQSVGWTKGNIAGQILFETVLQTMLGFVVGAIPSLAVITFLGTVTIQAASKGLESTPTTITMPLALSSVVVVEYFGMAIMISLLVSYLLTKKIAAVKPSENLRSL